MVKYGGHVEALREGDNKGTDLYLVNYNELKALIFDKNGGVESFPKAWKEELSLANEDHRKVQTEQWSHVFETIAECEEANVRGANPGNALKLYVDNVHPDRSQGLLLRMNQMQRAATTNSESLRKLVKKFDKYTSKKLSLTLLPLLYSSSIYCGQHMMQDGVNLMRELLQESNQAFAPMLRNDSEAHHEKAVEMRFEEFDWLKRLVASIPPKDLLPRLVAHRGFHHIKDRNNKRPIENSLSAYEMAWTAGLKLCECDIALTKDEKLVLAHDENFIRLALDSKAANSQKKVSDLTFRELISMPLRSGIRPPLLIDVLRSAIAMSEESKLVIEIKPGNEAAASALARLLIRHADLRSAVAVIMSFDVVTMHRLRTLLNVIDDHHADAENNADHQHHVGMELSTSLGSGIHRRVTSFDHFGAMTFGSHAMMNSSEPSPTFGHHPSSALGLSLSQANLDQLPEDGLQSSKSLKSITTPMTPTKPHNTNHSSSSQMPKLMLLTVADPPKKPCELQVSVENLSPAENWLSTHDGALDGVYLQFEKHMMTDEGAASLREFSQRHMIGIWGYSGQDPDDYETFEWLSTKGNCTYVNTDLPNHFKKDVFVRSGSMSQ